jgi:cell division protein FtsB
MTLLRRPGAALAALLILLIGVAFLTQVVPYRQILDSRHQVAAARAELAALEAENEALAYDVAALQTDTEVERLAREKLGYVKPGETAYVVLDPPGAPEEPPEQVEVAPAEELSWLEQVWAFLTGADAEDGPTGG